MIKAYFDHAAAAPLLPEAREAMLAFLESEFGNPASLHSHGRRPKEAIDKARTSVAGLVNVRPDDIVFTSSASEAANHVLKGFALARQSHGRHLVVSAVEHVSVLEPARTLAKQGFELTELPVDSAGLVHPDRLAAAIRPDTALVAVQHGNNEVGAVQNLAELARICRERKVPLLSDGTAAVGRIPVDLSALGLEAYWFPAQSVYGPKGAAALWLRRNTRIPSLIEGGFQERNRRAGTENVAAIAGFGAAAAVASLHVSEWAAGMSSLAGRIRAELPKRIDRLVFTGPADNRLPGHVSVCVEFVEGEAMLLWLDEEGIAAASGSSCTAKTLKASHVLLAMGLPHAIAQTSLVLTLGKDSTEAETDHFLDKLPPIVERLRQMSPLYAKHRKGEDPYAVKPGEVCEEDDHHEQKEN